MKNFIEMLKLNKLNILIEGADCAGKSTLAYKLIENLSDSLVIYNGMSSSIHKERILASGANPGDLIAYSMLQKMEILNTINKQLILDRGYLTELIYSKHYRNYTKMTKDEIAFMANIPIVIICLPKSASFQKQMFRDNHSRGELYAIDERIDAVIDSYWNLKQSPFVQISNDEAIDISVYSKQVYTYDYTIDEIKLLY